MRLYKKAAVCLLAAAMAVSMMTACGGGAGGGAGDSGNGGAGGGDTTITVPKAEDIDLGNIGKSDEDTSEDAPKLSLIASTQSMSRAYMQKVKNANELYAELQVDQYDDDNFLVATTSEVAARKGKWSYIAMSMNFKSDNQKNFKGKYVIEEADDGEKYLYTTFDGGKYAVKATRNLNGEDIFNVDPNDLPNNMYKTSVKVNNKEYYAETYTETQTVTTSSGTKKTVLVDNVVCFDSPVNGNAVYEIRKYRSPVDGVSMIVIAIKPIQYNSRGLCQLPQECKVYTQIPDTTILGMKIKDSNGNIFVVGGDETLVVTNASGEDVSQQFQWLTKVDR